MLPHITERRRIYGILSYSARIDGCYLAAEEGKESYKTISGIGHKESELLCSLLFRDWNLLIKVSLKKTPPRGIV